MDGESRDPDGDDGSQVEPDDGEPAPGLVTVRGALVGVGLLWLTVVAAFGAIQAAAYGVLVDPVYLPVSVGAAVVSLAAADRTLRTFGYR